MSDLIGTLLDYNYNAAHEDHIHVEPPNRYIGIPPTRNPGMTVGVQRIYEALEAEFGRGEYFLDHNGRYVGNDAGVGWTHMGGYNRRYIGSGTTWSQHSWWNALDIGPYIMEDQEPFIQLLKGSGAMALTAKEEENVKKWNAQLEKLGSNGGYVKYVIPEVRKNIVTMDELEKALEAIQSGNVDAYARDLAERNAEKLDAVRDAL